MDKRLQWVDKITLDRINLMHPILRESLKDEYHNYVESCKETARGLID